MRAWQLERLGGELRLTDVPMPEVRPGSVRIRVEASALLSYLKDYVEGKLPSYTPPPKPFTIGTNAVGIVDAVGRDVWHVKPGQRVIVGSHFAARDNVAEPAQILIALTSISSDSGPVLADWPDGTLAEYALLPVEAVVPVEGLDTLDPVQLALTSRFVIPLGGLLRGRLAAGERLIVNGATGAFGTAAVLLGAAMGASQIIAAGRNPEALAAVARAGGPRVSPVQLTGEVAADAAALRAASGGGVQMAFDMVGRARDPKATLAALHSLRRGGRLVLMGSMMTDLPVPYGAIMLNDLEIIGQFMYPRGAHRRLLDLLRSGLLDMSPIRAAVYPLAQLPEAMAAAGAADNLQCVVVRP
jgi:alcohol dehydrogenase